MNGAIDWKCGKGDEKYNINGESLRGSSAIDLLQLCIDVYEMQLLCESFDVGTKGSH